ncbi:MAG: uroporphyrinogen decarboxylase family protein [Anaerolineales bacterium]|jgi:uroporphyrinogen decarboxylase
MAIRNKDIVMNSKERMLAVFNGNLPDQIPTGEIGIDYPITEAVLGHRTYYRAKHHEKEALWAGKRDEVVESQKQDLVALVRKLKWDFVPVFFTYAAGNRYAPVEIIDKSIWKDSFGRTWKYSEITEDILCVDMPQIDDAAIETLQKPFTPNESQLELVRYIVETLGKSHFIIGRTSIELRDAEPFIGGAPVDGTFPEAYGGLMMNMVDFSIRLMDDKVFIQRLLAATTERSTQVSLELVNAGVDAIVMDTDYCHQKGPWISPTSFREIVFPLLKKQIDAIHKAGAYVIKHTDGNIWPILDMLVDAGIDGLHGIQPSAGVSLQALKQRYGSRLVLFGAMEGEHLINDQPSEIRDLVREQILEASQGGRYVLTSSNSVQFGTPPQNYLAMLNALEEYGKYG